jgi:hypothetical protein
VTILFPTSLKDQGQPAPDPDRTARDQSRTAAAWSTVPWGTRERGSKPGCPVSPERQGPQGIRPKRVDGRKVARKKPNKRQRQANRARKGLQALTAVREIERQDGLPLQTPEPVRQIKYETSRYTGRGKPNRRPGKWNWDKGQEQAQAERNELDRANQGQETATGTRDYARQVKPLTWTHENQTSPDRTEQAHNLARGAGAKRPDKPGKAWRGTGEKEVKEWPQIRGRVCGPNR